ncbi:MAG: topoisomerase II, partial [Actinobacteria bacterium]|nr:topoisomerase II [Actinomycetota bacterium]
VVALARLRAAGEHTLGDDTELLGAFRAAGLLVPVLEVSPDTEASDHVEALLALQGRYAEALGQDDPLTPQERRAREGLISRQVTLR